MKIKNKTSRPPRVRVGEYSAFVQNGEINVVGIDYGLEYPVANFTKENVEDVRSLIENATPENKAKADARLAALRDELASVEKIRTRIFTEVNAAKQEARNIITLIPSYNTAQLIGDNITVGCTTISVRTFNRLAKLLDSARK